MNAKEISKLERKQASENILGISAIEFNKLSPVEQRKYLKQRAKDLTKCKKNSDTENVKE